MSTTTTDTTTHSERVAAGMRKAKAAGHGQKFGRPRVDPLRENAAWTLLQSGWSVYATRRALGVGAEVIARARARIDRQDELEAVIRELEASGIAAEPDQN